MDLQLLFVVEVLIPVIFEGESHYTACNLWCILRHGSQAKMLQFSEETSTE